MQNIKVANNWSGDDFWTKIGHVTIKGDPKASNIPVGATQSDGEKTVQGWQQVAALKASPINDVFIGYITKDNSHISLLNRPITTDSKGLFGMLIGSDNVTFYLLPKDLTTSTALSVVEVTNKENPKYQDLPIY